VQRSSCPRQTLTAHTATGPSGLDGNPCDPMVLDGHLLKGAASTEKSAVTIDAADARLPPAETLPPPTSASPHQHTQSKRHKRSKSLPNDKAASHAILSLHFRNPGPSQTLQLKPQSS